MGCGTALPSLVLFRHAIETEIAPINFTFTDFNASVLRLVTVPNLLLTWTSTLPATASPFSEASPNPLVSSPTGELDITPELVGAFAKQLANIGQHVTLISGSWAPAPQYLSLIEQDESMNTLVLASETIYSPASLSTFTEALIGILKRARIAKAMVAAKRVYFGVGGSVDSFKIEAASRGAVAYEIDNTGLDLDGSGVRRCLMEVQMM